MIAGEPLYTRWARPFATSPNIWGATRQVWFGQDQHRNQRNFRTLGARHNTEMARYGQHAPNIGPAVDSENPEQPALSVRAAANFVAPSDGPRGTGTRQ